MKRLLVPLFALLTFHAFAQPPVNETMTVTVVQVPVYVTHDGQPVRGLTKDDFELYVNGKRQTIDYFDVIDAAAPSTQVTKPGEKPAEAGLPARLRERRLFLLVFDLTFTNRARVDRAQKAARAMMEHAVPGDVFAVATLSFNHGLRFVVPFTSDAAEIDQAIRTLNGTHRKDPLHIASPAALDLPYTDYARDRDVATQGTADELIIDPVVAKLIQNPVIENQIEPFRRMVNAYITDLSIGAERLAGLKGTKHIVLFTSGFNSSVLYNGFGGGPDPRLLKARQTMIDQCRSSGVFLDAVDVNGLRPKVNDMEKNSLFILANDTGGQVVHNRNDLPVAVTELAAERRVEYLIGFKPHHARKGDNSIRVRVTGAPQGSSIYYRQGFRGTETKRPDDALLLADIILNDVPQTGAAAALATHQTRDGAAIHVTLPTRELAAELGATGSAQLLLYIFDDAGRAIDFKGQRVAISESAPAEVSYDLDFALKPGRYVAKALLRIEHPESIGFSKEAFTVEAQAH